jgi:hypothetical protein
MVDAMSALVGRIDDDRPFDVDRAELEPLWIEAANQRLQQQRARIPVLDRLASAVGVREIASLDDLVPLLFAHTVYKSYPKSLLDKQRWAGLAKWLDTIAAERIDPIDPTGITSQDEWLLALKAAGHPIYATSGTSGRSSFLPATVADRELTRRCLIRTAKWQFGLSTEQPLPVVILGPSRGASRVVEYYRDFTETYGDPASSAFLTDDALQLGDIQRMARLNAAIAAGTAKPSEIAAFQSEAAERQQRLDGEWDRLVDHVVGLEGRRVAIMGFWAQQWTLVEKLRARGKTSLPLDPGSFLGVGGGTKGVVLPPDYREQIFGFFGLDNSRQSDGYGMSELSAAMPRIGDRYVIQPWIVPLILTDDGTARLAEKTGQHLGRFGFFDVSIDGRWGGLISGDRVLADYDTPNISIVAGSIVRYSELTGEDDDRLTCAGTLDAFVRNVMDGV